MGRRPNAYDPLVIEFNGSIGFRMLGIGFSQVYWEGFLINKTLVFSLVVIIDVIFFVVSGIQGVLVWGSDQSNWWWYILALWFRLSGDITDL